MLSTDWIDEALRDIAGMVIDLGPQPAVGKSLLDETFQAEPDAVAQRWQEAEANANRAARGLPPEWDEPPTSTLEAARYVMGLNDPEAADAFVVGRSAEECAAIAGYLKGLAS